MGDRMATIGMDRGGACPSNTICPSIQPFGYNTPTLQTGQTAQRSNNIERTVLQTVPKNGSLYAIGPLSTPMLSCLSVTTV